MMKDDHIYTLNHNINKLNQRLANNRPDNDNTKNVNQQIVNHILNKDIIGKTANQENGDLIDLVNAGVQHHSYITEALNAIKDQSDEPSVEDDYIEDIVIKPSSNYRVDEDRDPNYYKMIHHIDDLPTLIDNFLVYTCVLMLKELFLR